MENEEEKNNLENKQENNYSFSQTFLIKVKRLNKKVFYLIFSILLLSIIYYLLISPPKDFPENSIKVIVKGSSLQTISREPKNEKYIRSATLFQSLNILLGGERRIIAGDYLFKEKENILEIVFRIIRADFGMEEAKVTIPEGLATKEIASILKDNIINFDEKYFLENVKNKEGYLFPDTYFLPKTAKTEDIVMRMETNFKSKIKEFDKDIEKSGKTEKEILTMASILEGEAKDKESRQIVSGILWKRIKLKLPLQVDATFKYINGKGTSELTLDDLKINSPYNTYVKLGLPPTPINNPGTETIYSALNPIKTDYLYFLTGKDGKMYYAKDFEEHKRNKEKYLR